MTIELLGLELNAVHGVLEHERRKPQRFLVDVWLDVDDSVGATDRIEDAVDYREVVACVLEVSDGRAYHLLEAFTSALADALVQRFPVDTARVRVRKPDVVLAVAVEHAAVSAERRRSG